MNNLHVTILTIFPTMFPGPLGCSIAGTGLKNNVWSMDIINIRKFGLTRHKNVDDRPYGGGHGLVMRPDVLGAALDSVIYKNSKTLIIYPSPRGPLLNQKKVCALSKRKNIIILCGRFEGIDERIIEEYNIEQISVGDYILSGGEVAAIAILDSIIRVLPGILHNQETLKNESFEMEEKGVSLIEHPIYTRPAIWRQKKVPTVLLSGNHADISKWKKSESIRVTQEKKVITSTYNTLNT